MDTTNTVSKKAWYQRPEKYTGLLILAALGYGAFYFLPLIIVLAQNALYATFLLGALGAIVFAVLDKDVRTTAFYAWRMLTRTLTGFLINLDPIAIVETYLKQMKARLDEMVQSKDQLGGQRQRAAIIQQVLCSENFLLLDEPFSGLDLLMLEKTCALLTKIANLNELNTIIVVTHDVTAAASIADHLWLMGRDSDQEGNKVPGARIVKEYNLIDRGLTWNPEIITSSRFIDFVKEVKEQFRFL